MPKKPLRKQVRTVNPSPSELPTWNLTGDHQTPCRFYDRGLWPAPFTGSYEVCTNDLTAIEVNDPELDQPDRTALESNQGDLTTQHCQHCPHYQPCTTGEAQ